MRHFSAEGEGSLVGLLGTFVGCVNRGWEGRVGVDHQGILMLNSFSEDLVGKVLCVVIGCV